MSEVPEDEEVYQGTSYTGEHLIFSSTEAAIRSAISQAQSCRVVGVCPYCKALLDKALRAVADNLYRVYG